MEPHLVRTAKFRYGWQGIDGAGADGAGVANDRDGKTTVIQVR
jgi:hypothetical protein